LLLRLTPGRTPAELLEREANDAPRKPRRKKRVAFQGVCSGLTALDSLKNTLPSKERVGPQSKCEACTLSRGDYIALVKVRELAMPILGRRSKVSMSIISMRAVHASGRCI
jgi:hypothetical protein